MTLKDLRVYTLAECSHCKVLEGWLRGNNISFEKGSFDGEVQVASIIRTTASFRGARAKFSIVRREK